MIDQRPGLTGRTDFQQGELYLDNQRFVSCWLIHSLLVGEMINNVLLWELLKSVGWDRIPGFVVCTRIVPNHHRGIVIGNVIQHQWRRQVEAVLSPILPRHLLYWHDALECLILCDSEFADADIEVMRTRASSGLTIGARFALGLTRCSDGVAGLTHSIQVAREAARQAVLFGQSFLCAEDMDSEIHTMADESGNVIHIDQNGDSTEAESCETETPRLEPSKSPRSRIIQAAVDYIQSHLADELSLTRIAVYCSVSTYHLSHLFRKEMGMTLTAFIKSLRLKKARELLLNSSLTVSEIAYQVGFSDPNYFSKTFRVTYGLPPSEYRSHRHSFSHP